MMAHDDLTFNVIGAIMESPWCKKRRGKKEPPLWTVSEGLYWAVALGQNSRGRVSKETKGVCEVGGGEERLYS